MLDLGGAWPGDPKGNSDKTGGSRAVTRRAENMTKGRFRPDFGLRDVNPRRQLKPGLPEQAARQRRSDTDQEKGADPQRPLELWKR